MTNSKVRTKIPNFEFLVVFLLVLVKIGCGNENKRKNWLICRKQIKIRNFSRKQDGEFSLLSVEITSGN